MADATEVSTTTRNSVSKRQFVNEKGEWTSRVDIDSVGFKIDILDNGEVAETIEGSLSDLEPGIVNAAALFGLVTAITNSFGGLSKSGPIEEVIQAAQDRWATFTEGEWAEARQSGPRTSQYLEAAIAVRQDTGKPITDEWKDKFLARLKSDENYKKDLAKNAVFAAKLAAIKAKAATELAERKAAKAKDQDASSGADLLD